MREVSHFVIVFPDRLIRAGEQEREMLIDALRREYPHYKFDVYPGRSFASEDEFAIIPVMGGLGDGTPNDDPDRVYMCKPLDPKVIPDLVRTLQVYEALGSSVN